MNPHFLTLVLGIAGQADSALSGTLPPEMLAQSGGNAKQLAQTLIDTLAMLEQKTHGHLESDEQKILGDALTALRFKFIQTR
jgi:Domain of unknown function (DUF1844)